MNKIFQTLALSFLVMSFAVPANLFAADEAAPAEKTEKAEKSTKKKEDNRQPSFSVFLKNGDMWEVNYPKDLYPKSERKSVYQDKEKATIFQDKKGYGFKRKEVDEATNVEMTKEKRFTDISKIEWPAKDPRVTQAQNELMRGNVQNALEIAETFLNFFKPLKTIEGSPWIRAAGIKLSALDQQENDVSLTSFIEEIKGTAGWTDIEGLPEQVKLAELNQMMRRAEYKQVLKMADDMMKGKTDVELLARLHLIKGKATLALGQYEPALKIFLRIPVFYGNQAVYVPAAKLNAAQCFKRMNRPEYAAMKLDEQAENYLEEIITEYPYSVEAKAALAELPKHKRDAIAAKGSIEEQAAKRAEVTSQIEIEQPDDDGGSSVDDDDSSSSSSGGSSDYDDSDYE